MVRAVDACFPFNLDLFSVFRADYPKALRLISGPRFFDFRAQEKGDLPLPGVLLGRSHVLQLITLMSPSGFAAVVS